MGGFLWTSLIALVLVFHITSGSFVQNSCSTDFYSFCLSFPWKYRLPREIHFLSIYHEGFNFHIDPIKTVRKLI